MKNVPMRILDGWARHKRRSHKEKVRFVGEKQQEQEEEEEEEYSEDYYNQEAEEEFGSNYDNDDYIDAVFE